MKHIVCGKFHNNISFNYSKSNEEKIRIGSKNPNILKVSNYNLCAIVEKNILFENKIYEIRDFFSIQRKQILKNLIVLTKKEKSLVLEECVDFNIHINVFEEKYPFFEVKFTSNIYKNYDELEKLIQQVINLDIRGKSLHQNLSQNYLYKIERKLRFKNKLDYYFAFAYKGGYQEVFKFKEERKDRVIIAFDFNSMYVDSMMNNFMEPKSIRYINLRDSKIDIANIKNGLYRVILKNPKETFFNNFHPFKYNYMFQSHYFNFEENHEIELLLFKNEIEYYGKFFESIEIIEGFHSNKTIQHPLKKYALQEYDKRLQYKKNKNEIMQNLSKNKLVCIHSASNKKNYKTLYFKNKRNMIKYLSYKYMINFPFKMTDNEKLYLMSKYDYFTFTKCKLAYKAKIIDFDSNNSIYSLSAQILANSRLKMIQTIENFLSFESVEICYCNVDSIHISIKKDKIENFLQKYKYMISNRLGDLKIEVIAEQGYWFDIGRYWLFKNDKVELFKNIGFNHKFTKSEFIKSRKVKFIKKNNLFSYVKTFYLNIENCFTYTKKINENINIDTLESFDNINFSRYNFDEIFDYYVAQKSYNQEIIHSRTLKSELYKKIATE